MAFDRAAFRRKQRELEQTMSARMDDLYREMALIRGDAAKESALWTRTVDAIVEARRAAGHEDPTLLLAETLTIEGWGKHEPAFDVLDATDDEAKRWTDDVLASMGQGPRKAKKPPAKKPPAKKPPAKKSARRRR